MSFRKSTLGASLLLALLAVLALPSLAFAAEPNNTIATSQPLLIDDAAHSASLNYASDRWDVYSVNLAEGQKVSVRMSGAAGTDFDVFLFPPGSSSVESDTVFESVNEIYPEALTYVAPVTGKYYVGLYANSPSKGAYSLRAKVAQAASDDEIPGVALGGSPVAGYLNRYGDQDDVFAFPLSTGDSFRFTLSGPSTTDFDLFLYGSSAQSVFTGVPVYKKDGLTSKEKGLFTASSGGTYYVDLYSAFGSGQYKLAYETGELTKASFVAPSVVPYRGTASLEGTLTARGKPLAGKVVTIQGRAYNAKSWSKVTTVAAEADGSFSVKVKPPVRTSYRAYYRGQAGEYLSVYSSARTVAPKVAITGPYAVSSVRRATGFTVRGYLKPQHSPGGHTVRVYAQRWENGRWVTRKAFTTTNRDYSSYTRYSARISLPYRGTWRMQARYHSPRFANTKTAWRKITVR